VKLGIGIPLAIVGAMIMLAGLVVLAFVGFDGTFTTPRTSATTDTHAIVISASFVDEDFRSEDLGESSVTLDVVGRSGEVFVGVADTADVSAYLDGVAHAEATEVAYPGGDLGLRRVAGTEEPTPPEDEGFWTSSITGDGELTWALDEGDWSVVVMNADASAGVDVAGTATARIPILGTAVAVLLVLGVPLMIGGLAMIVSALRRGDGPSRHGHPGAGPDAGVAPSVGAAPAGTVPPRPDLPARGAGAR
jgi:hypothetical protein